MIRLSPDGRTFLSSPNNLIDRSFLVTNILIINENTMGPKVKPCGISQMKSIFSEMSLTETNCNRLERELSNQSRAQPLTPFNVPPFSKEFVD